MRGYGGLPGVTLGINLGWYKGVGFFLEQNAAEAIAHNAQYDPRNDEQLYPTYDPLLQPQTSRQTKIIYSFVSNSCQFVI